MIGLLALLAIVGIFSTLGFAIAEYKKTTWCLTLITSLCWIAFPILAIPAAGEMTVSYSRIFQPEVANLVVKMMYNLTFFVGIGGVITCIVTGIIWLIRKPVPPKPYMTAAKYRRHLDLRGFPKEVIDEAVCAYEEGLFGFKPPQDLVKKTTQRCTPLLSRTKNR